MVVVVEEVVGVEDDAVVDGSEVSDSSAGAADVVDIDVEVALVVVVVVLAEVDVGAAVTAGSDGSSVAGCDSKLCASAAASAASAAVVAVSGCATAAVTAPSAVGAELLLSVEQPAASRAADTAAASRKIFVFIRLDERPGTQQY